MNALDHVGVAVPDLEAALSALAPFLQSATVTREEVSEQGVSVAMVKLPGCHLELLSPLSPESPVGKFLAKRGPGLHHVAFRVEDVAAELARLEGQGYELIDRAPRRGAGGKSIAFLHPRSTGSVLVELCAPGTP
ncbi:MAG: methylmalonyl-CoA epimerase [Candidatus Eremiobacterota bacterium]